jgi:hypothetical protein
MCELTTLNGMTVLLDEEDYEWASAMTWNAYEVRGKWYARTTTRNQYLHRLIAGATKRTEEVDHINGNTLDNRRGNLRVVTHKQNQQNRRHGYGATGVRGVTITPNGRYLAQAKVDGKHLTFGRFDTLEEASEAALQGRLQHMTHSDPEARGITVLKESPAEYAA